MDAIQHVQGVTEAQRVSRIAPIMSGTDVKPSVKAAQAQAAGGLSFQDVLAGTMNETRALQFSKHASLRLSARNIQLSTDQLARVEQGVAAARVKGIQDSLVMVDDVALVVNIRSKTVITAMEKDPSNSVFTNIDGAVIV